MALISGASTSRSRPLSSAGGAAQPGLQYRVMMAPPLLPPHAFFSRMRLAGALLRSPPGRYLAILELAAHTDSAGTAKADPPAENKRRQRRSQLSHQCGKPLGVFHEFMRTPLNSSVRK